MTRLPLRAPGGPDVGLASGPLGNLALEVSCVCSVCGSVGLGCAAVGWPPASPVARWEQ